MSERMQEAADTVETASGAAPAPANARRGRTLLGALIFLGLAAAAVIGGLRPRLQAAAALAERTNENAPPAVAVVQPKRAATARELVLPATVQPFTDSPIYARSSGYLMHWYADIGTHVAAGAPLADLDTPEVDQELEQARADLATAQSNLALAQVTATRERAMLAQDAVSKQDADNANGELAARQTEVNSAAANVKRLTDLLAFNHITAPFEGVITARNVDVGALVDAGSGQRELFHIAAIQTLRVYVAVPQDDTPELRVGASAELTLTQFPGRRFTARLASTANALDPASRTLLTQFLLPNPGGTVLPGSFAELHLKLAAPRSVFQLPEGALLFRSAGPQVVVVTASGTAHLQDVTIGRDYGSELEVIEGLDGGERVVNNPPDSVVEGEQLRVVAGGTQPPAGRQ